jgi:RimJ/RimL family protein N-acetyltransferase
MTRTAVKSDFDYFYGLYMHPKVNPFLLYEQMSVEEFRPVFRELQEKGYLYVYQDQEGVPVGMFKLVPQQYRNSHMVYLGGLAIDPLFAGKGFARKMLQEIKERAIQKGFTRIELTVAVINEKAIRLYEQAGFLQEGRLRNLTFLASENRYIDEVIMSCLV